MFSRRLLFRYSLLCCLTAFLVGLSSCQISVTLPAANRSGGNGIISLSGAGGTFPAPLYERWFSEYNKVHSNVQVNYQPVGSIAGIEQFTDGTIDFGASDVAITDEQIAKVPQDQGAVLLPMTAGSIVLTYNLPNIESGLRLSREVYSDIFLGKITQWSDRKIAEINPDLTLPDLPITVMHRSDGSGTTGVFTMHLSAINSAWKDGPGQGPSIEWPTGTEAKGNDGVTALIQQIEGAIGYVEYGYAWKNNLPMADLENKAGKYIEPTLENAEAALATVKLPENLRAFIADPDGRSSYPIVTYTWILAHQHYADPVKAEALKDVLNWSLIEGQQYSKDLGYIPLPEAVINQVKPVLEKIS